jgi:hypothetical protein
MSQNDPRFVDAPKNISEFSALLEAGRYAITQGEKQLVRELLGVLSVSAQDISGALDTLRTSEQSALNHANAAAASATAAAEHADQAVQSAVAASKASGS